MAFNTTKEALTAHFQEAGNISNVNIIFRKSKKGQQSTGRGIVEFDDENGAIRAIKSLNGTELDGRNITVRGAHKMQSSDAITPESAITTSSVSKKSAAEEVSKVPSSTKLYVTNLSWSTTDSDLESYFSRLGEVKSANVKKSKAGRSYGQGIVEFSLSVTASDALERLNNSELDGRQISVRPFYE